ncbi:MAG: MFS transporter, partial [Firmicutes bacterium]|nr:MFS transporter [Bacillota bacterium]
VQSHLSGHLFRGLRRIQLGEDRAFPIRSLFAPPCLPLAVFAANALCSPGAVAHAAFHPQASAMVTAVSGERKGFYQALFVAAGNVGWALTPLMVVPFIAGYGLGRSYLLVLPGLLVGALLWLSAPKMPLLKKQSGPQPGLWESLRPAAPELFRVVMVVSARSLAYFGLVTFLPLYLQHENVSLLAGSRMLFLMLFSGALGGLLGGYLSDIFGRRAVIAGSLVLATPLFYLYLATAGALSYILLALAGASLLASFSVTIVAAQEVIGKNAALASGLMLGFGIGVGGLGVGLVGVMVARFGIVAAIHFLIWLPVVAGLIGLTLRGKKREPAFEGAGGVSVGRE